MSDSLLKRRQQFLKEMEAILSGFTHDLCNPLAVISGQASLIEAWSKRDMLDATKAQNSAQKILSAFERSMSYLELLRQFYKTSNHHEFELQSVLTTIIKLCGLKFDQDQSRFHLTLPEEPLIIQGDKSVYTLLFWDLYFYCLSVNQMSGTKIVVQGHGPVKITVMTKIESDNSDKWDMLCESADFLAVKLSKNTSQIDLILPN
jgi:hypothetical protein